MEELQQELTLEEKVDEIIEKLFDEKCAETCEDSYYKNQYLKYAIENHNSLQCICRTYAECLYSGEALYTGEKSDLYHGNQVFTYLQNYIDTSKIYYLEALLTPFLNELEEQNEYIILYCFGRKKSFRSLEAKVRYKILMNQFLNETIDNFDDIKEFTQFDDEEKLQIRQHLANLLATVSKKNPSKDLLGIRFVVDKITHSNCSEAELIEFCYELKSDLVDFFGSNGIELIESKDYIAEPKDDKYQSLHLIFEVLGSPIEIQIRTGKMHYTAEYGEANHQEVYKDTLLQNFTREFLYNISKEKHERLISNENNCFLKSYNFFERHISKTPNGEIPNSPLKLKRTSDENFVKFLEKVHTKK